MKHLAVVGLGLDQWAEKAAVGRSRASYARPVTAVWPHRSYSESYFWERIQVGDPDECWLWLAGTFQERGGYGAFRDADGKVKSAHRRAFELTKGTIPRGLHVLHHCDNPPCCNPICLFAGTNADNIHDMDDKGRRLGSPPKGLEHRSAKLTHDQVREIRARAGEGIRPLAREFPVSRTNIRAIILRKIWKDVPDV